VAADIFQSRLIVDFGGHGSGNRERLPFLAPEKPLPGVWPRPQKSFLLSVRLRRAAVKLGEINRWQSFLGEPAKPWAGESHSFLEGINAFEDRVVDHYESG